MFKTFLVMMFACAVAPSFAQTAAPSTDQMIRQLKAPQTRSLRNLSVEAAPPPISTSAQSANDPTSLPAVPPASRPSLSLLIQFDFNSASIRTESQQALNNLAQALQSVELQNSNFAVEGHTDAKGKADYNQKLSQQRAQAVRDFLKNQGVAEDRLMAAGKGATELANRDQPFAAENRRVRIVNLD